MDEIDLFFYINLEHRVERKQEILSVLSELGVPSQKIRRIPGVKDNPGFLGCAQAHLNAIRTAIALGARRICILEDDFMNHVPADEFRSRVFQAMMHLRDDFDVFFLAMSPIRLSPEAIDGLHRVRGALSMSGYVVHRRYYRKLAEAFERAIHQKIPIDMITQGLQAHDAWYGFYPVIAQQRAGFSDIEGRQVDYGYMDVKGHMLRR